MHFKDFINEATTLFKRLDLLSKSFIPIDRNMMDNLGYSYNSDAYHITSVQWLKKLKSIEGTNKQISCFSKGSTELMKLPSNPNVLVKLKGNVVISGKSDIWTWLDSKGYRWIDSKNKKLENDIKNIIIKLMKEFNLNVSNIKDSKNISTNIRTLEIKEIKLFIKNYLDRLEKYLDKGGYKLLNESLNNITYRYNELIMDNIEIIGAYSIENDTKKEDIQKENIKYLGIISMKEIDKISD